MAFLVDTADAGTGSPAPAPHPLAPLTAAEIEAASAAVKAVRGPQGHRAVRLHLALRAAPSTTSSRSRTAPRPPPTGWSRSCCGSARSGRPTKGSSGCQRAGRPGQAGAEVIDFKRVPGVQPSVMLEEFLAAEDVVRKDPRWQEAMRKRGIEDFDLCMIDPWSTPNVEPGRRPGRRPLRLARSPGSAARRATTATPARSRTCSPSSTWTRSPSSRSRTTASSRSPSKSANYSADKITDPDNVPYFPDGPRTDVKPFDITQHEGPSFTVDGQPPELAEVGPADRLHRPRGPGPAPGRLRPEPVHHLPRARCREMFVPYGDPGLTHYRKLVFDEGEYGIGPAHQLPRARLRLPGRDRLPRRRRQRQRRPRR